MTVATTHATLLAGATVTRVSHVSHVDGQRTVVMVVDGDGDGDAIHVGATLHQGGRSWGVVGVVVSKHADRPAEIGFMIRGDGDPSVGSVGVSTSTTCSRTP